MSGSREEGWLCGPGWRSDGESVVSVTDQHGRAGGWLSNVTETFPVFSLILAFFPRSSFE